MKDWLGGSYLVMKSDPRFPVEIPILAIEYKYNCRNVLGFIATEGAGNTAPGDPYLSPSLSFILIFLFDPLFILT